MDRPTSPSIGCNLVRCVQERNLGSPSAPTNLSPKVIKNMSRRPSNTFFTTMLGPEHSPPSTSMELKFRLSTGDCGGFLKKEVKKSIDVRAYVVRMLRDAMQSSYCRMIGYLTLSFCRSVHAAARAHSTLQCTAEPHGLTFCGPAQFLDLRGPRAHISCYLVRFSLTRSSLGPCLSVSV